MGHIIPVGVVVDDPKLEYLKQITYSVHMEPRDMEFMFDESFNTGECSERPSLFFQPADLWDACYADHDPILKKEMPCTFKFDVNYAFKNSSVEINSAGYYAIYGGTLASYRKGDIIFPDGSIKKDSESFLLAHKSGDYSNFYVYDAYINGDDKLCNQTKFNQYEIKKQYPLISDIYNIELNGTYVFKKGSDKWKGVECDSYFTKLTYDHYSNIGIKEITYVKDDYVIGVSRIAKNYTEPTEPVELYSQQYDLKYANPKYSELIMPKRFEKCQEDAYGSVYPEINCDLPSSSSSSSVGEGNIASIAITLVAFMLLFVSFISFY